MSTFWQRLLAAWCLGQLFLTFRYRLASESDPFFGVEYGALSDVSIEYPFIGQSDHSPPRPVT